MLRAQLLKLISRAFSKALPNELPSADSQSIPALVRTPFGVPSFDVWQATPTFRNLAAEPVTAAYDGTVAYDGSRNSSSAYEDTARPPNAEEKHASGAARTLFGRFDALLAAETTVATADSAANAINGVRLARQLSSDAMFNSAGALSRKRLTEQRK
jgi:hypothetical protein